MKIPGFSEVSSCEFGLYSASALARFTNRLPRTERRARNCTDVVFILIGICMILCCVSNPF